MFRRKRNSALISDDICQNTRFRSLDNASLKVLTLLHDRLFFNVLSEKHYHKQDDLYRGKAREYDDLFIEPREEAPQDWVLLKKIWKPIPYKFNTLDNPKAFRAVEYAGGSGLPGFGELDIFFARALQLAIRQAG